MEPDDGPYGDGGSASFRSGSAQATPDSPATGSLPVRRARVDVPRVAATRVRRGRALVPLPYSEAPAVPDSVMTVRVH